MTISKMTSFPPFFGFYRRLVNLVDKMPFYSAGGLGSISGRIDTQGIKIIEEKVLPLL